MACSRVGVRKDRPLKLWNQTEKRLKFELGGSIHEVEPFGSLDVHPDLAPFAESRGLPLATSQVPPPVQAQKAADEAQAEANASEIIQLRKITTEQGLKLAESDKVNVELASDLAKAKAENAASAKEIERLKEELVIAKADKEAFAKQVEKMAATKASEEATKKPAKEPKEPKV